MQTFPNRADIYTVDNIIQSIGNNNYQNDNNHYFINDNNYFDYFPITTNENPFNSNYQIDYNSFVNNTHYGGQSIIYPQNTYQYNNYDYEGIFNEHFYDINNNNNIVHSLTYSFNQPNYNNILNTNQNNQIKLPLFVKDEMQSKINSVIKNNNEQNENNNDTEEKDVNSNKEEEEEEKESNSNREEKDDNNNSEEKVENNNNEEKDDNNNDYPNNEENESNNQNQNNSLILNKSKLLKDFNPDFWTNFYDKGDKFFNYDYNRDDDLINKTIITYDPENIKETYIGQINNKGERHGFGKLIRPDMIRIGTWRNNEFTGWGREIMESGEIFEGKFIKGKINGKGIYKKDSIFYIGNFKNSIKDGKGEIFTNDYHYVGNFINDNCDGKGRIDIYNEAIYEGNFEDGKISGYGVYKWLNGQSYEGEMKNGIMDGYGKLIYENGIIYEGYFKNGKIDGRGTLSNKEGNIYKGKFNKGIPSKTN